MEVEKHNIAEMICEKLSCIKENLCKVSTVPLYNMIPWLCWLLCTCSYRFFM